AQPPRSSGQPGVSRPYVGAVQHVGVDRGHFFGLRRLVKNEIRERCRGSDSDRSSRLYLGRSCERPPAGSGRVGASWAARQGYYDRDGGKRALLLVGGVGL